MTQRSKTCSDVPCGCNRARRMALSVCLGAAVALATAQAAQAVIHNFIVTLGQECPACPAGGSPGSGSGTFQLNTATGVASYNIAFGGLAAPENNAHVHGPASACGGTPPVTAGVIYGLPLGSPKVGNSPALTAAQQADMLNQRHYVNIHSGACPGGEIRGQIIEVRACCNPDNGACSVLTQAQCSTQGGVWGAPGSTCSPNPCPQFPCEPSPLDPTRCRSVTCSTPGQVCQPKCVKFVPATGQSQVLSCECGSPNDCHAVIPTPPATNPCPPPLERGAGNPCVEPDAGGTVTLPPPGCGYVSPDDLHEIIAGLPPGTTVNVGIEHNKFFTQNSGPGGSLGGEFEQFTSFLMMHLCGTGQLSNYNRFANMQVQCETHIGPRTPGNPVQSFDTDMFMVQGQLPPGDPDFDLLRITGGTAFGMPSPGHTTLTQLPGGQWAVDSFFDVTYRIDFVGRAGGPFGGMSGSTTGTIRMGTGGGPSCQGGCPPGTTCQEQRTVNADGSIDVCCNCVPIVCEPDSAQPDSCRPVTCPNPNQICVPRCVVYNPQSGQTVVIDCDCRDTFECYVNVPGAGGPEARGGGNPCQVPDNGGGTVTLPPAGCDYLSPNQVHEIIDGLPPGTTIELAPIHQQFICSKGVQNPVCSFPVDVDCSQFGGSMGGEQECVRSTANFQLHGTGSLAGFDRPVSIPVGFETHIGPRTPGQPVQSFDTDMFRMFGQITGDPDFDLLRITGGTDFGLPSPGHTTLTQLPGGMWAVDSFFDITYRIDFVGHSPGPLAGRSGSTTGTIRMSTGQGPSCQGACPPGTECRETRTVNPNGTIQICCDCVPIVCEPDPLAPDTCKNTTCPVAGDRCVPKCVRYNPTTGQTNVLVCECRGPEDCHVFVPGVIQAGAAGERGGGNPCVVTGGGGTVVLPPVGCEYLSPDDVHRIVDGLPPNTTIELAPIHRDFICNRQPGGAGVCSFPTPVDCDEPGGSLGGEKECADSQLNFQMTGTGGLAGFNRTAVIPISFETHVGPRTPGNPVQSFDTDMFRLFGQITNPGAGDPDFDLLRIVGGTDFGLPSPGHTTLTNVGGNQWAVDSFFDITYRIDFVGKAGGPLGGMSGSTTGTIRMATGPGPSCQGICPPGTTCQETRTFNPADGTIDICCNCVPVCQCPGDVNGDCVINSKDIGPFIRCFLNPAISPNCACADINNDGSINGTDVGLLVGLLTQSPKPVCPTPCVPAP